MISELHIPENFEGLHASVLKGLGEIVLLAGKNGSGKTRILHAVELNGRNDVGGTPVQRRQQLKKLKEEIVLTQHQWDISKILHGPASRGELGPRLEQLNAQLATLEGVVSNEPYVVANGPITAVGLHLNDVTFADPKPSLGRSADSFSPADGFLLNVAAAISDGPDAVYALLSDWAASFNPSSALTGKERTHLENEVTRLNNIVAPLLGTRFELGHASQGPRLFGRPLRDGSELSDGQKVLLAIAYALFLQPSPRAPTILWDEPELFLHPSASIDVIERVRTACPGAQLWIATHSVHLLAKYESHGIWFVEDGNVKRSGRESDSVLGSLLGDASRIEGLHEFLTSPAQRAMKRFAVECLSPPSTARTKPGDLQTLQIRDWLWKRAESGPINILDFGAGKGRLLGELAADPKIVASGAIVYHAYDLRPSADDQLAVAGHLAAANLTPKDRYRFVPAADDDSAEPLDRAPLTPSDVLAPWAGKFDVVVLCNALHEILPDDWSTLFGPDGQITAVLKPEGSLLIVEDYVLAVGERAHEFGFLLLDADELRMLFKITDASEIATAHADGDYFERLKAHAIACSAVKRMDGKSLLHALRALCARSVRDAYEVREGIRDCSNRGRALAVAAHQYLNAQLALQAMEAKSASAHTNK